MTLEDDAAVFSIMGEEEYNKLRINIARDHFSQENPGVSIPDFFIDGQNRIVFEAKLHSDSPGKNFIITPSKESK